MKSAFLSIVSATLFVAGVSAQSTLTVNTPLNVVVCQPLLLTWSGGTGPYFLSIHPGAAPDDAALEDFGQQQGTSFSWTKVNFPAGTSLDITLRDSAGLTSQSAPFTVQTGSDTSCLTASSSSASGSSSSTPVPSTTGTGTASTPSATTPTSTGTSPTATTPTTSKPTTSTTSSSSTRASTTPTSNAAMPTNGVSYGAAGLLGAVVAAVLA